MKAIRSLPGKIAINQPFERAKEELPRMYPNYSQGVSHAHFSVGESGLKLICICIMALGIAAYIAYSSDNQDIAQSAAWPTVNGTLKEIGQDGLGLPVIGRYLPICRPYAKYTYMVDNKSFSGEKSGGICLSLVRALTWHHPEPQIQKPEDFANLMREDEQEAINAGRQADQEYRRAQFQKRLEKIGQVQYKPVKVRYEKGHPAHSVLDPDVLQCDKSQLYTSVLLIGIGGLLLGGLVLHGFVTAPTEDPSLSLEAARAQQRQRRK